MWVAVESGRRPSDSLELWSKVVMSCLARVLGTKLGSVTPAPSLQLSHVIFGKSLSLSELPKQKLFTAMSEFYPVGGSPFARRRKVSIPLVHP